ncbi:hypothetical protein [Kitasatospora sp. NPDC127116]|uniref:hypothetical protein n=1 Tax=Kitasatospora sp. NPDC127116 TaxID=3345367 RepID=UPI003627FD04
MEKRNVPGLGHISAIGAGCWTIGGLAANDGVPIGWTGVDEDEAYNALVRAHDLGITSGSTNTASPETLRSRVSAGFQVPAKTVVEEMTPGSPESQLPHVGLQRQSREAIRCRSADSPCGMCPARDRSSLSPAPTTAVPTMTRAAVLGPGLSAC